VNKTYDEVIDFFMADTPISWRLNDILYDYEERIKGLEKSIENAKSKSEDSLFSSSIEWLEESIQDVRGKAVRLKDIMDQGPRHTWTQAERRAVVTAYLAYRGVSIKAEYENTVVSGGTSMHNSYLDMPTYIQALVLHFSFEDPSSIICKADLDH
jgi:hypothetical protein